MYRIVFAKRADRALRKMPRGAANLIRKKLNLIAIAPHAEHNSATKLQGRPGYCLRAGDWHGIYEVRGAELVILVLKIGPRGGKYR